MYWACIGKYVCRNILRLVRFDLEVQGQGQTMEMANNFVNIAPRALQCIGHL